MSDRTHLITHLLSVTVLAVTLSACGGGETDYTDADAADSVTVASDSLTITGVGFAGPESVIHDSAADVYLVSNINGNSMEVDGNGFISRMSPEGDVLDLKWIDGEAEGVTLNAPKGMAIDGGMLYVTDIDCIRKFDLETGAVEGAVCVEGAAFLNDLAAHPEGGVIFTDMGRNASFEPTGTDAVYHLTGESYEQIVADENMNGPNGLTVRDGEIIVVSYFGGEIFRAGEGAAEPMFPASEGAQLDGVEALADGRLLVSDWGSNCVLVVNTDGDTTCVVENVESPADIGIDRNRNRVLIPLLTTNEVWIRPIG